LPVLAGGHQAVFEAVEGAEDDRDQGGVDLRLAQVGPDDVVLLLAASGTTPYVLGALQAAQQAGALTIGLSTTPARRWPQQADIGIVLDTGAEGVGQHAAEGRHGAEDRAEQLLDSVMVRMNKVFGNLMVDLRATNAKLRRARCGW
jgi:N-acetylmuramic acid 6-phosphate etherase